MNTELTGVIVTFLLTVLLAYPLGKYIAKVFAGERTVTHFMNPFERLFTAFPALTPARP
jgi:K+-transporting ATPase ATPase A chain